MLSVTTAAEYATWRDVADLCSPLTAPQLQRMDMEARSYSPDKSRQLLQKVREYKADLAKLKEDAKKAASSGADTRCDRSVGVMLVGARQAYRPLAALRLSAQQGLSGCTSALIWAVQLLCHLNA